VALPSDATLIVDGRITLSDNAPTEAALLTNADFDGGNSNIVIVGIGELNGGWDRQSASSRHSLVRLNACSTVTLDLSSATGNRYTAKDREQSGAAIHIMGGRNHAVSVGSLSNYGREGIWLHEVTDSAVTNTRTYGGSDSWSGVQVGGVTSRRNRIIGVWSFRAGASAIGCDSKDSLVMDCLTRENAYFHGFNFGHAGQPANNTVGLRLSSYLAGTKGSGTEDFDGFGIVNGSHGVQLGNCVSRNAFKDGFNVSAGANDVRLYRCIASGSGRYGLNASRASVVAVECDFASNAVGATSSPSGGSIEIE